jgi:hypothetical protein
VVQVDVGPPQGARLATAQAGEGHDLEQGAQAVLAGVVEEGTQLGRLQGPDLARPAGSRGHVGGGVVADQSGAAGGGERRTQDGVDFALGGLASAGGADRAQHLLDVGRAKVSEPHVADGRHDVALDVEPVHGRRGSPQAVRLAVGQPAGQVAGQCLPAVVPVLAGGDGDQHLGQGGIGLGLGGEPALALLAAATGCVPADIGAVVPGAVPSLSPQAGAVWEQLPGVVAAAAAAERRALHDWSSSSR